MKQGMWPSSHPGGERAGYGSLAAPFPSPPLTTTTTMHTQEEKGGTTMMSDGGNELPVLSVLAPPPVVSPTLSGCPPGGVTDTAHTGFPFPLSHPSTGAPPHLVVLDTSRASHLPTTWPTVSLASSSPALAESLGLAPPQPQEEGKATDGLRSATDWMRMNDAAAAEALLALNMEALNKEIAAVRAHYTTAAHPGSFSPSSRRSGEWTSFSPSSSAADGGVAALEATLSRTALGIPNASLSSSYPVTPAQGNGSTTTAPLPEKPASSSLVQEEGTAATRPRSVPAPLSSAAAKTGVAKQEGRSARGAAKRSVVGTSSHKTASGSQRMMSSSPPRDLQDLYRLTAASRASGTEKKKATVAKRVTLSPLPRKSARVERGPQPSATHTTRSASRMLRRSPYAKKGSTPVTEKRGTLQARYESGPRPAPQRAKKGNTSLQATLQKSHSGPGQESYSRKPWNTTPMPASTAPIREKDSNREKRFSERDKRVFDGKGEEEDVWHISSSPLFDVARPSEAYGMPYAMQVQERDEVQQRRRQILERVALLSHAFR